MGLVRSLDEIAAITQHFHQGAILGDAVMIMATFRTKAEVVKRVLPPPLEPDPESTGLAYVAEFHRTNFGPPYKEGPYSSQHACMQKQSRQKEFIPHLVSGVNGNYRFSNSCSIRRCAKCLKYRTMDEWN